jgi:hypothetical protein
MVPTYNLQPGILWRSGGAAALAAGLPATGARNQKLFTEIERLRIGLAVNNNETDRRIAKVSAWRQSNTSSMNTASPSGGAWLFSGCSPLP